MCESGLIQDYIDKCDSKTDKILFEIKTTRDFTRAHESERSLYEAFKLIKSLPETYCCIDETGKVKEFLSAKDILDSFIDIRLKHYNRRKDYLLANIKNNIEIFLSKYLFIKAIVDKTLKISNRKRTDIENDISKIDKIIKVNDSYDYLISMPISSLTKEKMDELKQKINSYKEEFKTIKATSVSDMWLTDLSPLRKNTGKNRS
jgi:DNA topoisomerase-2